MLAHEGEAEAEEDREEQHLQDLSRGKGADHRLRDDVHQEAGDALVMGLRGETRDRLDVERLRIDVQPGARLEQVGDHQTDDQGEGREGEEIDERLHADAPDLLEVGHAGDTADHGEEDHRRDDHLHELDEGVAERLHLLADLRIEMSEQDARCDGAEHLDVQDLVERLVGLRWRRVGDGVGHVTSSFMGGPVGNVAVSPLVPRGGHSPGFPLLSAGPAGALATATRVPERGRRNTQC